MSFHYIIDGDQPEYTFHGDSMQVRVFYANDTEMSDPISLIFTGKNSFVQVLTILWILLAMMIVVNNYFSVMGYK